MHSSRGFTLVELSIVLVIIGLLTGGVLTGQSLIRASELRSVTSQYGRYVTAVQTFRDKYFALPGDMTNATKYWTAAAAGTTCATTTGTGTATCDGDGNGSIDVSANSNELFRFWQHLANAGLIEGSYPGVTASTYNAATVANVPLGRITSTLWHIQNMGSPSGSGNMFDGQYGNTFFFGSPVPNNSPGGAVFKPEEAYNIDQKMDDGKPATGKIVTLAGIPDCTDAPNSTVLSANYLLSSQSKVCGLFFRQQF